MGRNSLLLLLLLPHLLLLRVVVVVRKHLIYIWMPWRLGWAVVVCR